MSLDERGPGWTAERALAALVDALDEAVLLFDAELRCRAAGARVAPLLGADPAELLGLTRAEVVRRLAAAAADGAAFEAAALAARTAPQRIELVRPEPRILVWTSRPLLEAGAPAGAIDLVRDVTRELAAERRADDAARALAEAATTDPLTGLLTRRRFLQDLDREHRRAQRAWDSYAVVRIDVDRMKDLNAAHGRDIGDALLRCLGEELRASRREYDLVARWEQDELAMCLPGVDPRAAMVVVERVLLSMRERGRAAVEEALRARGAAPGTEDWTTSAGIAVWVPPSGDTPEDVVRRAGEALAAARTKGPASILVDTGAGRWKDGMTDG
ncbi:MAG: diguanylate cyclase [Polyangiaceae bacterium]|nr:diguanylate cyclase [Polyangiaceae bacterium]